MRNVILLAALALAFVSCTKESISCYTIDRVSEHNNELPYYTYFTAEGRIFDHYANIYEVGDVVCNDEIESYAR